MKKINICVDFNTFNIHIGNECVKNIPNYDQSKLNFWEKTFGKKEITKEIKSDLRKFFKLTKKEAYKMDYCVDTFFILIPISFNFKIKEFIENILKEPEIPKYFICSSLFFSWINYFNLKLKNEINKDTSFIIYTNHKNQKFFLHSKWEKSSNKLELLEETKIRKWKYSKNKISYLSSLPYEKMVIIDTKEIVCDNFYDLFSGECNKYKTTMIYQNLNLAKKRNMLSCLEMLE